MHCFVILIYFKVGFAMIFTFLDALVWNILFLHLIRMIKLNGFLFWFTIMVSKEKQDHEDAIHNEDVCIFRLESGFLKQRIHDIEDAS